MIYTRKPCYINSTTRCSLDFFYYVQQVNLPEYSESEFASDSSEDGNDYNGLDKTKDSNQVISITEFY